MLLELVCWCSRRVSVSDCVNVDEIQDAQLYDTSEPSWYDYII